MNEKPLRIQVAASHQQADILTKAAADAGARDRSAWILAHALKAANAQNVDNAPVVIGGDLANRLRAEAKRQGTTPEQVMEQLLTAAS